MDLKGIYLANHRTVPSSALAAISVVIHLLSPIRTSFTLTHNTDDVDVETTLF